MPYRELCFSAAPRHALLLRARAALVVPASQALPRCAYSRAPPAAMVPPPVSELRVSYSKTGLDEAQMPSCPFNLFSRWMAEAQEAREPEPNAMTLATVAQNGRPSARLVLLKGVDERGFVFYTNYESRKAVHLHHAPFAAATFWWAGLERSVRVEGTVVKVSEAESDNYFHSRPPESRLGAWASEQSRPLDSRHTIEDKWSNLRSEYLDEDGSLKKELQRPPHWGGFRLVPDRIEFWKGRTARLHDRIVYERPLPEVLDGFAKDDAAESTVWSKTRLQP